MCPTGDRRERPPSLGRCARRGAPAALEIERVLVLLLHDVHEDPCDLPRLLRRQRRPGTAFTAVGDARTAVSPAELGAVRVERPEVGLLALDRRGLLRRSPQDRLPLRCTYKPAATRSTGLAARELLPGQLLVVRPVLGERDLGGLAAPARPKGIRARGGIDDEVDDQPVAAFRMRECFRR